MEYSSKGKAVKSLSLSFYFKDAFGARHSSLAVTAEPRTDLHHCGLRVSDYYSLTLEKEDALPTTKSKLYLSTHNSPITQIMSFAPQNINCSGSMMDYPIRNTVNKTITIGRKLGS